jgi:uncharacterized protein
VTRPHPDPAAARAPHATARPVARAPRPRAPAAAAAAPGIAARLAALDWPALAASLAQWGYARTPPVLTAAECEALAALYEHDARFRSRIHMERYRYGAGDYAYFAHPLPAAVRALRSGLYARLAPIANGWMEALREEARYPATLEDYLQRCHAAGQTRPTPLLLRYGADGYNCLHQDRYGPLAFPLQATAFLSRPGVDYEGGAFLLVEQHPRQQSRGEALLPAQGELVLFANAVRPVRGTRGWYRAAVRHGVGRITSGRRFTLGLIFHDAE